MIRRIFILLLLIGSLNSVAQQGLQMELIGPDSVQLENERRLLYNRLISGSPAPALFMEEVALPEFSLESTLYDRYQINPAALPKSENLEYFMPNGTMFTTFHPFISNGTVFSNAAYQLNDRFTVGGFSYGANSVFSNKIPAPGMNNFDFRGSTLFMQYKVSKSVKIETRVSVSGGAGY